jgi:hypothetical protein
MPIPNVTQEVWTPRAFMTPAHPEPISNAVGICVERDAYNHDLILQAHGGTSSNEERHARVVLAARAPTFFRLLEQVLISVELPEALEEIIRLNLHRAAPDVVRMPPRVPIVRKSSWEKILDDDLD